MERLYDEHAYRTLLKIKLPKERGFRSDATEELLLVSYSEQILKEPFCS